MAEGKSKAEGRSCFFDWFLQAVIMQLDRILISCWFSVINSVIFGLISGLFVIIFSNIGPKVYGRFLVGPSMRQRKTDKEPLFNLSCLEIFT